MDYKALTNEQLSAILLYAYTEVGNYNPDLIKEIANRLDNGTKMQELRDARLRDIAKVNKIQAIKEYRALTGSPLKVSLAYIDGLLGRPTSEA